MGTSQPSISRALAQLRVLLDDPLLVRSRRGMELTRRAEELLAPVQRWLETTSTLFDPSSFDPASLRRRFRIASTDFGVLAVIAPVLPCLIDLAPHATIGIVPLKGGMHDELASGDVDLLVSGLEPDLSQAYARNLFVETFSCLMRADHPLAEETGEIPLETFVAWPHVALTVGEDDFDRIDSRLGALGLQRRVVASVPYFSASAGVIGASDAIVTLPSRAAAQLAPGHKLAMRPAPREMGSFQYRLLWHERTERDPASMWLRDELARDHPSATRMIDIRSGYLPAA